jgi:hypothetical protein
MTGNSSKSLAALKRETQVTLKRDAFDKWVGDRDKLFGSVLNTSRPNFKTILFLATLEAQQESGDHWCNYNLAEKKIIKHGLVDQDVDLVKLRGNLRVALKNLIQTLKDDGHPFQIERAESKDVGQKRDARFRLVNYGPRAAFSRQVAKSELICFVLDNPPYDKPARIAKELVRNRRLPFWALFALSNPSVRWLHDDLVSSEQRSWYEAEAFVGLGALARLSKAAREAGNICRVVGLACGGGQGEIALLRTLLNKPRPNGTLLNDQGLPYNSQISNEDTRRPPITDLPREIHYVAVDTSPTVLMMHLQSLREVFREEIESGKLKCAMIVGNDFQLNEALTRVRLGMASNDGAREFFAAGPVLATYLGNCLGNDLPDHEWSIFNSLQTAFPEEENLQVLLGVSVRRNEEDTYSSDIFEFLLETPHLLLSIGVLESKRLPGDPRPSEFARPESERCENPLIASLRCGLENGGRDNSEIIPVESYKHEGLNRIKSQVYRFNYRTDFDLVCQDGSTLPAGSEILLYAITKYEMTSLKKYLSKQRLSVHHDPTYDQILETKYGPRQYAVISVTMPKSKAPRGENDV